MRKNNFLAQVAACAAGLGLLLPSGAVSAAVQPTTQSVRQVASDVVLTNGTLTGQYITAEGTAVDGAVVSIRQGGRELARATTDSKGVFNVPGLKAGVYEIATPGGLEMVRAWEANTAPPSANQYATVVSSSTVRGQACDGGVGHGLCGAGGVDLVSGAALAIGIAGLATGIVGITRAGDARRDVRRLRTEFEAAEADFQAQLDLQAELIQDLQDQIDAIVSP